MGLGEWKGEGREETAIFEDGYQRSAGKGRGQPRGSSDVHLSAFPHSHADLASDTRNLASFEISAYSRKPTNIPTQNEQQISAKEQ